MKRISPILTLPMVGCLSGCVVQPMKATDLFGVSNPTMRVKVPGYGSVEIPTDFKGKFKVDKSPDGTLKLDITVDSKVSDVVTAEGNRIAVMEAQRIADIERAVAQEQIRSTERIETLKGIFGLVQAVIPAIVKPPIPATEPVP